MIKETPWAECCWLYRVYDQRLWRRSRFDSLGLEEENWAINVYYQSLASKWSLSQSLLAPEEYSTHLLNLINTDVVPPVCQACPPRLPVVNSHKLFNNRWSGQAKLCCSNKKLWDLSIFNCNVYFSITLRSSLGEWVSVQKALLPVVHSQELWPWPHLTNSRPLQGNGSKPGTSCSFFIFNL